LKWPRRHCDWQLLAGHVDLREIADDDLYFAKRPTDAAKAVLQAAEL
jgi:hypothetical protein